MIKNSIFSFCSFLTTRNQLAGTFLALGLVVAAGNPLAASADYVEREDVQDFINQLVSRHQFERDELNQVLGNAQHQAQVIRLITPPSQKSAPRSWQSYRARFVDKERIRRGVEFWQQHEAELQRAETSYGVAPEIIVAIIGVETFYGRHTGNFQTLSALTTLAFDYPPRATLFRNELEALFLLAREQGRSPLDYHGSFAGALGLPQFLPSSVRSYAVDFNDDGMIDFDQDAIDAIGSVANYLHQHGWQHGASVAEPAKLAPGTDAAALVAAGIEPALEPGALFEAGVSTHNGKPPAAVATLVDLETPGKDTAYWLGYRNFYVITRYNRSSFYAMSVFELAEAIRLQRLVDQIRRERAAD